MKLHRNLRTDYLGCRSALIVVAILIAGMGAGTIVMRMTSNNDFHKIVTTEQYNRVSSDEPLATPAAFSAEVVDVNDGPTEVPLEISIPSLQVDAQVLGVGMTKRKAMDAPIGKADSPIWQQAFWYRGSAIPGAVSTALIGGHVNGPRGVSGVFAHLDQLVDGDLIVIRDTRTDLDVRFEVDEVKTYTLSQAGSPSILGKIYGTGPVEGKVPALSGDGLAHLTLITCAGTFKGSTHDHRLVIYATRVK